MHRPGKATVTLERTTIPAPLGKFQRYLVQKLEPIGFIILDVVHWDEEGRVGHCVMHSRPEYTREDCRAVVQWLNNRDKVLTAYERLFEGLVNYFDKHGEPPLRMKLDNRYFNQLLLTCPAPCYAHEIALFGTPRKIADVPYDLERNAPWDYQFIMADGMPERLSEL